MTNDPGDYNGEDDGSIYVGDDTTVWYDNDGDQHCDYTGDE